MTFLIWAGAVVLLAFSLTPYSPKSNIFTDTPAHFALQTAIGSALLLALAIACRVQGEMYLALLAAYFLSVFQLLPYLKGRKRPAGTGGVTLKLLQANIWVHNPHASRLKQLIHDENPDIIAAAEVHSPFAALFEEMKSSYPYQHIIVKNDSSFGAGILSKIPFDRFEEKHLASPGIPSLFARIIVNEKPLDIVVMHAENPLKSIAVRDAEFDALAKWHEETMPHRLIVTGDLNATPYCPALKNLMKRTGLVNTRAGRGLFGTFCKPDAFLHLPFMRLPIDHTLASVAVKIEDFRSAPAIGSDHLPTITVIRA